MKDKVKSAYDLLSGRELSILPGNLAYSFFLALIPILTLLFYVLTKFNLPLDIIVKFFKKCYYTI